MVDGVALIWTKNSAQPLSKVVSYRVDAFFAHILSFPSNLIPVIPAQPCAKLKKRKLTMMENSVDS